MSELLKILLLLFIPVIIWLLRKGRNDSYKLMPTDAQKESMWKKTKSEDRRAPGIR